MKKDRDSRFEMLRLISIFLIVLHHLVLHSAIKNYTGISFNRMITQLYLIGGKLGVNCFIFITGYFSIKKKFKCNKIFSIELQTLFYTILFLIITLIIFPEKISIKNILGSFFPTIFGTYWYITAFMGILLLSPMINIVLNKISFQQYMFLLVISIFMFSISPTVFRQRNWTNDLLWFITLYCIGGAVYRFKDIFKKIKSSLWLIGCIVAVIITWGISLVIMFLAEFWNAKLESYVNVFSLSTYSTFVLMASFCLFMYFVNMQSFENRLINKLASYTLGIYLIQSNPFVADIFLWRWIEHFEWYTKKLWPLYAMIITCAICIICIGIDNIRFRMMKHTHFFEIISKKIDSIWQ